MVEACKGVLWQVGLEQDKQLLQQQILDTAMTESSSGNAGSDADVAHVMLSYEWNSQATVVKLKEELEKLG